MSDADIVERLDLHRSWRDSHGELNDAPNKAATEITLLRQRVEELEAGLRIADSWLERWAVHVGACQSGEGCTCGLTRVRYDVARTLLEKGEKG